MRKKQFSESNFMPKERKVPQHQMHSVQTCDEDGFHPVLVSQHAFYGFDNFP